MTAKAVIMALDKRRTLWQDALSRFGFSWSVLSEVVWLPKTSGVPQFERLRRREWRGQGWPKGGLYAYKADLEEWEPDQSYAQQRRIVLTLKDLPELVNSLFETNAQGPESVLRFLNRWGLLGVRVPEHRAPLSPLAPGILNADGVDLTQRCLTRLQTAFRGPTLAERLQQVDALRQELPVKSLTMNLTLDLSPSGPELGICAVPRPLTAFIVAALCSAPLQQCEECKKFFPVGSQPRRYCSDACSGRVRARAYYARHRPGSSKKKRRTAR